MAHIMQRVKVELSWANNFTEPPYPSLVGELSLHSTPLCKPHGLLLLLLLSVLVIQAHSWAGECVCVCVVYVCGVCSVCSVCISGAAERALSAEGFMCTDMQLKGKDNKRLQIAQEEEEKEAGREQRRNQGSSKE